MPARILKASGSPLDRADPLQHEKRPDKEGRQKQANEDNHAKVLHSQILPIGTGAANTRPDRVAQPTYTIGAVPMAQASQSRPNRGAGVKALLALGVALWAVPAQAQKLQCAPAAIARAVMEEQGAKPFVVMLANGVPVEIWALPDGSEFKMFFVKDGMACLVMSGTDLRVVANPGQGT